MAATNLNDLYQAMGSLTQAVEGLKEQSERSEKSLKEQIASNEKRNEDAIRSANESRANVHRRLDDIVARTSHLETSVKEVRQTIEQVKNVTDDVTLMRTQAQGAGTLGRWLIRIGIGVVGAAGWLMAYYTQITGKPPP